MAEVPDFNTDAPDPNYDRVRFSLRKQSRLSDKFRYTTSQLASVRGDRTIEVFTRKKEKQIPTESLEAVDKAVSFRYGSPKQRMESDVLHAEAIKAGFVMGGLICLRLGSRAPLSRLTRKEARLVFTEFTMSIARDVVHSPFDLEDLLNNKARSDLGRSAIGAIDYKLKPLYEDTTEVSDRQNQGLYLDALTTATIPGLLMLAEDAMASTGRGITSRQALEYSRGMNEYLGTIPEYFPTEPPAGSEA
jgi:hypothetical protein